MELNEDNPFLVKEYVQETHKSPALPIQKLIKRISFTTGCQGGLTGDEFEPTKTIELSSSLPSSGSIPLLPFSNQVGGHGAILKFSDKTILKHLDETEKRFYETVDKWYPQLNPFIPNFYGIVDVNYSCQTNTSTPSSSGSFMLQPEINYSSNKQILHVLRNISKPAAAQRRKSHQTHKRAYSADNNRLEKLKPESSDEASKRNLSDNTKTDILPRSKSDGLLESFNTMSVKSVPRSTGGERKRQASKQALNPWSLQLYKEEFECDKPKTSNIHESKKYVVLEDLTFGLKNPCILDLKMGTRHYGLHATPVKKKSQQSKAAKTTSATLGVRICGMQVFQVALKKYIFQSKYDGRKLDPNTFKETLWQFVNDGNRYLTEIIPLIVERLEMLRRVVSNLKNFRFYCSSLLIIYEGSWIGKDNSRSQSAPPRLLRSHSIGVNSEKEQRKVDIRMIDFAHSIVDLGENEDIDLIDSEEEQIDSPDSGYLLGLDTLISAFKELEYNCLMS